MVDFDDQPPRVTKVQADLLVPVCDELVGTCMWQEAPEELLDIIEAQGREVDSAILELRRLLAREPTA